MVTGVDLNNGGSLEGLLAGLAETIARAGPEIRIIPGLGPIVGRAAVVAQRDMVLAVRDRVAKLVPPSATLGVCPNRSSANGSNGLEAPARRAAAVGQFEAAILQDCLPECGCSRDPATYWVCAGAYRLRLRGDRRPVAH
jgi:hypothetical protein